MSNLIALIDGQPKSSEDIDTHTNIPSLPALSTVGVQWEDNDPWMH